MTRNIIKYGGLTLVLIGIILVMKNLFTNGSDWTTDNKRKNKNGYYSAQISLLDKETESYLSGANLVVKDASGQVVSGWTTEAGVHLVENLKNGTYTLNQETAIEGYHLNEDNIVFEINGADETVVMYNIAYTEEEKKQIEEENRQNNTTSSDVNVENTASHKSILTNIIALISLGLGTFMIALQKKVHQL